MDKVLLESLYSDDINSIQSKLYYILLGELDGVDKDSRNLRTRELEYKLSFHTTKSFFDHPFKDLRPSISKAVKPVDASMNKDKVIVVPVFRSSQHLLRTMIPYLGYHESRVLRRYKETLKYIPVCRNDMGRKHVNAPTTYAGLKIDDLSNYKDVPNDKFIEITNMYGTGQSIKGYRSYIHILDPNDFNMTGDKVEFFRDGSALVSKFFSQETYSSIIVQNKELLRNLQKTYGIRHIHLLFSSWGFVEDTISCTTLSRLSNKYNILHLEYGGHIIDCLWSRKKPMVVKKKGIENNIVLMRSLFNVHAHVLFERDEDEKDTED